MPKMDGKAKQFDLFMSELFLFVYADDFDVFSRWFELECAMCQLH